MQVRQEVTHAAALLLAAYSSAKTPGSGAGVLGAVAVLLLPALLLPGLAYGPAAEVCKMLPQVTRDEVLGGNKQPAGLVTKSRAGVCCCCSALQDAAVTADACYTEWQAPSRSQGVANRNFRW